MYKECRQWGCATFPSSIPVLSLLADKKLRNLDILRNIASDPDAWILRADENLNRPLQPPPRGEGLEGVRAEVMKLTQGDDGEWMETAVSASGSIREGALGPLGDLPLFLQHVALMRELDEHRDKASWGHSGRLHC